MAKILLLVEGSGGDLFPFIQVGLELKSRGHEVVLLSGKAFEGRAREAGFGFAPIDDFQPYGPWAAEQGLADDAEARARFFVHSSALVFRTAVEHAAAPDAVLVAGTSLNLVAQTVVDALDVPYAPMIIAPYNVTILDTTAGLYAAYGAHLNRSRAELGLPPVADWRAWLSSGHRAIGLWPEWFGEQNAGWVWDVRPVGFVEPGEVVDAPLPEDVLAFLEEGGPTVLVTHGTSHCEKGEFFSAGVGACRLLGLRCVVVTPQGELVEGLVSENVRYYRRLPFGSLLRRVRAVIHHGGIGTGAQALAAAVPQLVLPYKHDRPDNAARLKSLGVADWLPPFKWKPEPVAESLRGLVESEA
ncbi:MAG TPA: nucleotide disphospho-sugar-binding domain-containing protein, partial [Pyrinomonadaceae bacterium]